MDNSQGNNNREIPKWLKNLQDNSWELELLISGGAIFTLFQMSSIWVDWINSIKITGSIGALNLIMLLGTVGIEILKVGFITHLISRALWLSMVCANYVFPLGIKKDKINWQKPFNPKVEDKEDLFHVIMNIDMFCGLVMFLSIISTFILFGILLTFFLILSVPVALGVQTGMVGGVVFIIFIGYILDLLLGGLLRKIPFLSYFIYPFFVFFDLISFRFTFQKALFLFKTNISIRKFTGLAILFVSFALVFSYLNVYTAMQWPNVFDKRGYKWMLAESEFMSNKIYRDCIDEKENSPYHIQSKIIKSNYVDLFIRYDFKIDCFVDLAKKLGGINYVSDLFEVFIDEKKIDNLEWHPYWNHNISNIGVTTMISIRELQNGKHNLSFRLNEAFILKLKKLYSKETEVYQILEHNYFETVYIPFWKDN